MARKKTLDARSEDGIIVGLIDGIIATAALLKRMNWEHPEVKEALRDLRQDEDVLKLMNWNLPMVSAEQERIMQAIQNAHALLEKNEIIAKIMRPMTDQEVSELEKKYGKAEG